MAGDIRTKVHKYDAENLAAARYVLTHWHRIAGATQIWADAFIRKMGSEADRQMLARLKGQQ